MGAADMNLRQCEVFRAVMEAGSVTAAAERLHVTQPAVSKTLAQLERELGFRVFRRERQRLHPTPEAQALYHEVRRAFIGLDYLTRFAGDLRDLRQGHLVVAALHAASGSWLPTVVAGFLRRFPGLSISLQAMDSPSVAEAVATGRVDLGIVQFEVPSQGLRRETLRSVEAVCVLPPDHRLAQQATVRPADLHDQPFIALAAVNRFRTKLDGVLKAAGVTPRIGVDTPLAATACALVMEGAGIAIVDRLSAEANLHLGIVIRPFAPRIAEDLTLLIPLNRPSAAMAAAFADALREHFALGGAA
jgi:DNA-binding transcriptional LysR family regulator